MKPEWKLAEDELLPRQGQPRRTAAAATTAAAAGTPMSDKGVSVGVAAVRSGSATAAIAAHQVDRLAGRQQSAGEIQTDSSAAATAATAAIMPRRAGVAMRGRASRRTGLSDMAQISWWNRLENG